MGQRKRSSERSEQSGIVGWAIALLVILGLFAGVGVAVVKMWPEGGYRGDECKVAGGVDGKASYAFDPEQAGNAATIAAVAHARGLPERAVTIALATAMQESKLVNIDYGDRDSLGLFQQRPSQGWGTPEQVTDPVYAAGKFFDGLVKVADYLTLPVTVAAQKVQRSGYPEAYAKHESKAAALAAVLTGRVPAGLGCRIKAQPDVVQAGSLRTALTDDFGATVPTGSVTEAVPGVLAVAAGNASARGWTLAAWAVAQSAELDIREVAYGGKVWTREDGGKGWRTGVPKAPQGGKAPAADPAAVLIRYTD